jgi:hypothetical protein
MLMTSGIDLVKCEIEVFSLALPKIPVIWNVTVCGWTGSS